MAVAVAKLDIEFAIEKCGAIPEKADFGIKSSVVRSSLDSQPCVTQLLCQKR